MPERWSWQGYEKTGTLYSEVGEFVSIDLGGEGAGLQLWEFQIIIPFNLAIPLFRRCPSTTQIGKNVSTHIKDICYNIGDNKEKLEKPKHPSIGYWLKIIN